jgi:hypothetical protein
MIVWISERGRARRDVRVKVSLVHGRRARPDRPASVSVRPTVEVVAGSELDRRDMETRSPVDRNEPGRDRCILERRSAHR